MLEGPARGEIDVMYTRHERVLICIILLQLAMDSLYDIVSVVQIRPSSVELVGMYKGRMELKTAETVLCAAFIVQVSYQVVYYAIAILVLWTRYHRLYETLGHFALIGVFILVLLAYADKFNFPVFVLRLVAYVYARLMQTTVASLRLRPPVQPAAWP